MFSPSHSTHCLGLLNQSQAALSAGNRIESARLAAEAWAGGVTVGDHSIRAQAELTLAQIDVLESRFQKAQERSTKAAQYFDEVGMLEKLPLALEVQSYASVSQGQSAEAITAACAAVSLQEIASNPRLIAQGLNYLGVAQTYANELPSALDSLEAAVWYAKESGVEGAQMQPLLNLGLASLMAFPLVSLPSSTSPEVQEFSALVQRLEQLHESTRHRAFTLHAGVEPIAHVFREFLTASQLALANRCDEATGHLVTCNMWLEQLPRESWLRALGWWAQALQAIRRGQTQRALSCCREMGTAAALGGHAPLKVRAMDIERALKLSLS